MKERSKDITESNLIKISRENMNHLLNKIEELGVKEIIEKKLELTEANEFSHEDEIGYSKPIT